MKVLTTTIALIFAATAIALENNSSVDSGGGRTTNTAAAYANDACIGCIGGVSSAGETTARPGYMGQLTETMSLTVNGTPATVSEDATTKLSGSAIMDDDSVTPLTGSEIHWDAPEWPLTDISASGLATAGLVYANTSATITGTYLGVAGSGGLLVLDTLLDNYGTYAGDGINDSWQNRYFGLDNQDAGPLADPDGDSQSNAFEFAAGLVPTDPLSRFLLHIEPVAGELAKERLVFGPCLSDRTYTPLFSTNLLSDSWQDLTNTDVSDNGAERTVTDLDASQPARFYRIQITPP